jgi:glutamyl/glutaminyl-tRNA synthetase
MRITHIIRGDDHLSNTAIQAALYHAFNLPLPLFWHLQMMCNKEGKKFSKRDFGFSLQDLRADGYSAQAICNYVALMGATFEQEVQSTDELASSIDFDNGYSTAPIKFDQDKLMWLNHKWIERLADHDLVRSIKPYVHESFSVSSELTDERMISLIKLIKSDLKTFKDAPALLRFFFVEPQVSTQEIQSKIGEHASAASPLRMSS